MKIQYMREFIAFDEYGNFSKTAQSMYITQPALSRHVAEMEKELVDYARVQLSKLDFVTLYMTPNEENHSSVISFNINGVHPHDVASILDSVGVCIRSRKSLCTATFKIFRNRFNMPSKLLYLQYKRRC